MGLARDEAGAVSEGLGAQALTIYGDRDGGVTGAVVWRMAALGVWALGFQRSASGLPTLLLCKV